MKTLIIILFVITTSLSANLDAQISENAVKGYVTGLKSNNTGLIESCLMEVVKIKLKYPETDINDFEAALKNKIDSEKSFLIRYKMIVTMYILQNPASMKAEEIENYNDPKQFFILAGSKLNQDIASL